ncbi:MAG: hypothetical protein L3J79_07805 [Candidatus Marinimicrobia bacterium]|nr:hypothetical protein [Candidatus Neomarinimicrobiota bacterium]
MDNLKSNKIHDGKLVNQMLTNRSMSSAEFGRNMDWSKNHVYKQLEEKDWLTSDLAKAGGLLNHNFFNAYVTQDIPKLLKSVLVPADAISDPEKLKQVQGEFLAIADQIRNSESHTANIPPK